MRNVNRQRMADQQAGPAGNSMPVLPTGCRIGEDACRGHITSHQAAGSVIRPGAEFEPNRDFQCYRSKVQDAVAELAALVNGRERLLMRARRKYKALIIAAT